MRKLIRSVGGFYVIRDEDGDIGLTYECYDEDSPVFYLSVAGEYTVDSRLAELRAACVSPRDRVIQAAQKYVASEGTDGFGELTKAVEAFEESDGDDSE